MYEQEFIDRLIELRTKMGVSARDMSYSLNFNRNYINSIELGKSLPSLSGFFDICNFLKITPKDFFNYDIKDTKKYNTLLDDLKLLSSSDLESIENIVHSLSLTPKH